MTNVKNKSSELIRINYKNHINKAFNSVYHLKRKKKICAIAHFDLPRSTIKMLEDQPKTITNMLKHNLICRNIIKENDGQVIKELGDAVLATFRDAATACECGLRVIHNFKKYGRGICTKVTVTAGTIETTRTADILDVYGLPVNLCNRMAKYACTDSIIIEADRFREVKEWLPNDNHIRFKKPRKVKLSDFGRIELREILLRC